MTEIPTIEPFQFIRSTAFSERVQLANKLNEVIDALNKIGTVDDLQSQIDAINSEISEIQTAIGNTDTSLAELENQLNALISEVNTTIKQSISALESRVDGIDSQLDSMQTEIDGKLSSIPIGGTNIGGVKNGGNVTINADGTMNASGTGTGITQNVLTYAGNKLKSTVNGVDSNEVEIVAGGGGVSSVAVTNPSPGNITVNVDGKSGNADIDTLASGIEVYGSEFPADSGNASAYIKLNDSISAGEIGKYTESNISFIRIGNEDTRLLADTVELRNEVPDEGCKLTSGANGELLVNGVAMKNYTLPVGGTALGGVKNGGNVTIDTQGNMNAPTTPAYTLPVASTTTLGGVKIGSGVSVGADGTISVSASGGRKETSINTFTRAYDFLKDTNRKVGDEFILAFIKTPDNEAVYCSGIYCPEINLWIATGIYIRSGTTAYPVVTIASTMAGNIQIGYISDTEVVYDNFKDVTILSGKGYTY